MKTIVRVAAVVTVFFLVAPMRICAAPGDLDATFNPPNGVVTYDGGTGQDHGRAVAIQSDGKIVVAGSSDNGADDDVIVLRYDADGTLDDTFGTGGVATHDEAGDYGQGVAIQSDGKIVVVGYSSGGLGDDLLVLRYDTDGTLDDTFDDDGVAIYDEGDDERGHAVAIQSDGKIVVVGESAGGTRGIIVLRYDTDGTLDNTFGAAGVAIYDRGIGTHGGQAVAIQSDGKIIVVGYTPNALDYDVTVLRYETDGTPDATFDGDGVATYDGGSGDDQGYGVAIQSDGKIIVVGSSTNGVDDDIIVLRYEADGSLDTTFSGDATDTYDGGFGDDQGYAVAIQENGRLLVAAYSDNGVDDDMIVLRYDTDGTLDDTFDGDGVATYDGGSGSDDGRAVAIQSDGQILVAGGTDNGSDEDVLVVRLEGDDVSEEDDDVPGSSGGGCFISTLWPTRRAVEKGF